MLLVLGGASLLFAAGLYLGGRLDRLPAGPEVPPAALAASVPAAGGDRERPDRRPPVARPADAPAHLPRGDESSSSGPYLALVIDDLGRSVRVLDDLLALDVPLSYSVLPYESKTERVVERLSAEGVELMCHLPMEAEGDANPGPGALLATMSTEELERLTRRALAAVPGAVGVNNHMGSTLSTRVDAMEAVVTVLQERGLFFLDSRTSPNSVAYATALERGLPTAERQVFLDTDADEASIGAQFRRLLGLADERGAAIAIAHPHPATLAVLRFEIPRALALGYRFVPVSRLLDRDDTP